MRKLPQRAIVCQPVMCRSAVFLQVSQRGQGGPMIADLERFNAAIACFDTG
jgi:hypothetical protein